MANSTLIIPIDSKYQKSSFRIVLDAVSYVFHLRWNDRMERWIMSIHDTSDTAVVVGIVCNTKINLLEQYGHLAVPQGLLMFYDFGRANGDPTYDSIGAGQSLTYTVSE